MARVDGDHAGGGLVYAYMFRREDERVRRAYEFIEEGSVFRYPRHRLERLRRGEPVEVEMCFLPDWAPEKTRPPAGRITVYPDE